MRNSSYFKMALTILLHSKVRSWLTIIGIVIGVGAVVGIISLSENMQKDMEDRLSEMDLTAIIISPGSSRAMMAMGPGGGGGGPSSSSEDTNLTKKDIIALRSIDGIKYIYGQISGREEVYFLGEKAELTITGVDPQVWQYASTSTAKSGRLLEPSDNYVAVIGSGVAEDVFDHEVGLNQVLTISGKSVRVVGILESEGGSTDNSIIMPIDAAVTLIEDAQPDVFDSIIVKAESMEIAETVSDDIKNKLMISRHVTEKDIDFSVSTSASMVETASEMMQSMTLFLAAIAGVSLIVGAVGIANTMFTSVMEKTREIGTMKAIGATNRDILMIFIMNSALVGLVGGILGVIAGSLMTSLFPLLGMQMMRSSMSISLSPRITVFGLFIAVAVGVISGVVPAYKASKMRPVDALRYE
ncbi:MAG: ABC transporter permease [Methanomethylovorans sp.]|jgi:putative ABC transport system permease protein|nr:ABC transporter permease [Methanomethylovorans sp.]